MSSQVEMMPAVIGSGEGCRVGVCCCRDIASDWAAARIDVDCSPWWMPPFDEAPPSGEDT